MFIENKLDKDIQRIIRPFNIILSIFFSSKFKIRDNHITESQKKYHLIIFFLVSFFNVICINVMFSKRDSKDQIDFDLKSETVFLVLYSICYILLVTCNIIHSSTNVSLILKIQDIHRTININKNIKSFITWNWIFFFLLFCDYILTSIVYTRMDINHFVDVSADLFTLAFNFNLLYGIRLMSLLVKYLEEWTKNIQIMEAGDNNVYCNKLYVSYRNILEAYKLHSKIFRLLVSFFFCFNI